MLSFNLAGLLRSTPGAARTYPVAGESLAVADDIRLAAPIDGQVRLSRTSRSILVRADFETALESRCGRCLRAIASPIRIRLDEEALPSIDLKTGLATDPIEDQDALRLDDHHELDLSEPLREAILLAEPIAPLCRPDCRGLCPECGLDLNDHPGHDHGPAPIDPRLAALAAWPREGDGPTD
ncbi:MAG: YceD family protein [Candidatus Limnocylindrales bacterium]